MPKLSVLNMQGNNVGEIELSDNVFGIEPNKSVMHQSVVNYLANQRQGTQSTLTRTEVRGGGRKPWRQKGTGNARQGSIRAPQWRHGGIALGPKPRDYSYSINRKVKRLALKSAFSSKVNENEMIVLDEIKTDDYKTKTIIAMLGAIGAGKKSLIVLPKLDGLDDTQRESAKKIINSARNIPGVKTTLVNTLNVYDILNYDNFIVSKEAVAQIEEVYA